MGLIADTYEAIADRTGRLVKSKGTSEWEPPPPHACAWCATRFSDPISMMEHVFQSHRHTHWYLTANDRVVKGPQVSIAGPLHSLELHYQKIPSQKVELQVFGGHADRKVLTRRLAGGRTSLSDLVPADAERVALRFRVPDSAVTDIDIESSLTLSEDFSAVEDLIGQLQGKLLRPLEPVEWEEWRRALFNKTNSRTGQRYAEGLFDYLYFTSPDADGSRRLTEAPQHFSRIWSLLQVIDTPMAVTASTLLAFKLNWFERLVALGPLSIFEVVGRFYSKSFEEFRRECQGDVPAPGNLGAVWADDHTANLIGAVRCFCARDAADLYPQLARLTPMPRPELEDKLCLLLARFHRVQGRYDQARTAYTTLKNHVQFNREAYELD